MSHSQCYSPTCPSHGTSSTAMTSSPSTASLHTMGGPSSGLRHEQGRESQVFSGAPEPDAIDKASLQKLEIHFFYPFFVIDPKPKKRNLENYMTQSQKKTGDDVDFLFGNDGHLLFEERKSCKQIQEINLHWAEDLVKKAQGETRGSSIFGIPLRKSEPRLEASSSLDTTIRKAGEAEKAKLKKRGSVRQVPFEAPVDVPGDSKAEIAITVTDSDGEASPEDSKGKKKKNVAEMQLLNPPAPAGPSSSSLSPDAAQKPKVHKLPATLGLKGHLFDLDQVFLCQYSDSIGILRFAVSSRTPVDVQMTLDLINGLMRLQEEKSERPSVMKDGKKLFTFHPLVFIEGLLSLHYGDKGINWEADKETDRLFVYSMGVVSGVTELALVQKVVYKISQMEDDARAVVDQDYLDEFCSGEGVYKRFANKEGGTWSTFHVDGGSTLIFAAAKDAKEIPIYQGERMVRKKKVIHGSSRPLLGFSLNELLIFRRMFLRRINQELDQLIVEAKSNRRTLMLIRSIHLRGLRFRAKFTAAKVSTTRAGKEQFLQWDSVMGIGDLQGRLQETLSQLNEYYTGIEDKANQKHIDILTIVLGCLGAISVVIELTSFYTTTDVTSGAPYYLPGAALAFFMLIAIFFIYWIRS